MGAQKLHAVLAEGIDAPVRPNVRAWAAALAEFEVVLMRRVPVLEHENELMLRAIECAHAGVRFGPDAEVLQFEVRVVAGVENFAEMAPIHADEKDGAVHEQG